MSKPPAQCVKCRYYVKVCLYGGLHRCKYHNLEAKRRRDWSPVPLQVCREEFCMYREEEGETSLFRGME